MEGNEATLDTVNVYLKQLQETVERIREQFLEPVLRQREAFQQWMQPIIEAQNALQETLEPILAEQKRWKNVVESIQISKYTLPDISQIVQPSLEFQKSIQGLITPAFEQLQESFRRLPPRTQEAVLLLGEHGWYLDLEMPIPGLWELKKALSEGNVEEAEEALAEYFTGRLDEIEASIIERFPNRQKMIRAAFNAHRRQEYELSIPVFLAQTDGICCANYQIMR